MLFNPKWKTKKTKTITPADLTFDDFLAWLAEQPADKTYDWYDPCHCAVGQYLTARTGAKLPGDLIVYTDLFGGWGSKTYENICRNTPHTFGAALKRAKAQR